MRRDNQQDRDLLRRSFVLGYPSSPRSSLQESKAHPVANLRVGQPRNRRVCETPHTHTRSSRVAYIAVFRAPRHRDATSPSNDFADIKIHGYSITDDHAERVERLRSEFPQAAWTSRRIDIPTFARMLAKLAHATAVGHYGLHAFDPLLPDVILHGNNCAHLVGCATDRIQPPVPMKIWARPEVRKIGTVKYIAIFLRLFAYLESAEFSVIS